MMRPVYFGMISIAMAGLSAQADDAYSELAKHALIPEKPFEAQVEMATVANTDAPKQVPLESGHVVYKKGYELALRDSFDVEARVISKRNYLGDERADIAPMDLAVGWGKLSDPNVLRNIYFRQNNRFLYWRVGEFPLPKKELEASTTNLHIIPQNAEVEEKLKAIKRGQVVKIKGFLVDAKSGGNDVWKTSRSREDSGDGACEIVLVERLEIY